MLIPPFKAYDLFVFQAEDGIRDYKVTGVQTCALPICLTGTSLANRDRTSLASSTAARRSSIREPKPLRTGGRNSDSRSAVTRSEERRVGKEGRSRWSPYH